MGRETGKELYRKVGTKETLKEVEMEGLIFESPDYWCGKLGYRPAPDGIGYRDFPIHHIKVEYILSKQPRGRLLDIGCAFGYIIRRLRNKGIDALGIDISRYALSRAPEDVKPYLKHGSADNLPWPDQYFDMVVTFGTLEHIDSEILPKAISEIKRVAKRGIIAITPGDAPNFGEDITHQTKRPLSWWRAQFPPEFEVHSDDNEKWMICLKCGSLMIGASVYTPNRLIYGGIKEYRDDGSLKEWWVCINPSCEDGERNQL
ncbi:class I SAM-dependent methyltransferase [Patescibacteria group bacterium]|nr:class I SAM-dependent methyltransferase [Patescibacteria group bacterium]